jgi:hypothetical protein
VKSVGAKDIVPMLNENEIIQTSVLLGDEVDARDIVTYNKLITDIFPAANATKVSAFLDIVREERWTKARLKYVYNKMLRSTYRDFQVGEFVKEDKTVTFGKTELALRRNLKFSITQNEIVMIKLKRFYNENGETKQDFVRAFAYKEEAEEVMPDKIVGRWNDEEHCFEYCGTIENHETDIRKAEFKKSLFQYCNKPPYEGEYDVDIVKQFFEYWSQIIPPGDMMKFETYMKFDVESALKSFNSNINN